MGTVQVNFFTPELKIKQILPCLTFLVIYQNFLFIFQFGIWTLFVTWVLLLVLAGRKLFIYHERENLIVSMSRDRRRYAAHGYNNLDK